MKLGAKTHICSENVDDVKRFMPVSDYVEIYYMEGHLSAASVIELNGKWVVHCPHDFNKNNIAMGIGIDDIEASIRFAGDIGARYAIIHLGGMKKTMERKLVLEKTAGIIARLNDLSKENNVRLLVENTYPAGLLDKVRLGCSVCEIATIVNETGCGFCLDFPHACAASVTLKIDSKILIEKFCKLKPEMFHLYDGFSNEEKDFHMPLGNGNLDIPFFVSNIKDEPVTLELNPPTLENFISSKKYLENIFEKS